MDYKYSELVDKAQEWAQQAESQQLISSELAAKILNLDTRTPADLLENTVERALIVGFFGGTGVGKSSLLNRLAVAEIAKTGVIRPTSHEVTLYHHAQVKLQQLPADLPVAKTQIAQHQNDAYQQLVWIDMPDFDSTESQNKTLVLSWLPHIDVLVYVVSPERYRDKAAWDLFRAEGANHGWIFVLNQWDKGCEAQYQALQQQLSVAEFKQPFIFRTDCSLSQADEFPQFLQTLSQFSSAKTLKKLSQHGLQVKIQHLQQQLTNCVAELNTVANFSQLKTYWQQQWQANAETFTSAFTWKLQQYAAHYAQKDSILTPKPSLDIWDAWAQTHYVNLITDLSLKAHQLKLPNAMFKPRLQTEATPIANIFQQQLELHCRQALIKPGNRLQHIFLAFNRVAEIILPLSAIAVVAYQVFQGFYMSSVGKQEYLSLNFASHSLLLIGISWLLPYFIHKKMQPSVEKSAFKGLQQGLRQGLTLLDEQIQASIQAQEAAQQQVLTELNTWIQHCATAAQSEVIAPENPLTRILTK